MKLHIFNGQSVYGREYGKYYGFNLADVLSIHFKTAAKYPREFAVQVGSKVWFW